MDRNREARRVPMAAAGNGLSRRRHRAGSFRDSPEGNNLVELPEVTRLRDRGGSAKKDRERDRDKMRERERDRERDRLNSRSKRRRGERLIMVHGNLDDDGDSSGDSVNDDEEYDDDGGIGPSSSLKMLPPANNILAASFSSSLSNHHNIGGNIHHHHHNNQRKNFPPTSKVFRSSPWKAVDEMIGVSVPRKARSACTKRPHESWASSVTGGGVLTSPARLSPASILASPSPPAPTSPSSSSVSVRKKMPSGTKQKPLPPKASSLKLSSPVVVEDEIEIEIAEVLYGMMRMPLTTSKQESAGNDLVDAGEKPSVEVKSRLSSPIVNSKTVLQSSITLTTNSISSNVSGSAPKRKKPRNIKHDDENSSSLPSRVVTISSNIKSETPFKSEVPFEMQLKRSRSAEENSSLLDSTNLSSDARESNALLDSRSAEKKENQIFKEETTLPKVEFSSEFRSDGDGAITIGAKISSPEKEKVGIDLMTPLPVKFSSERGGEMESMAAEAKPKVTEVETEAKPLLKEDGSDTMIVEPEENKKPRTVAKSEPHRSEKNCELKLDLDKRDPADVVQKQSPQELQLSVPDKTSQASPLPLHMSMSGLPGGLPAMGYMSPTQGIVSTNNSSLSSAAMQPPPHLLFNQPRPKRCATHCYIARNIQSHQQFTKMNSFWSAAASSAPLYGTNACNLSLMPPAELQGNVLGISSNPVPDKNFQSTSKSSDTTHQRNQILLQQALPPGSANNILHGPTYIFPLGQQPHATATLAAASVRPNNGITSSEAPATSTSMNGSATAAGAPTMSFSYPAMPGNETQYLAFLQNNGYTFPVPAHVGAPPVYRGASGQPIPFFNGSFYSSQMIQPPHLQPQKQQQVGQMLQSHPPSNQSGSVSTGSSVTQKHLQNQQLKPPINHENSQGFPTHKVQSQPSSFQQRQQPRETTKHSENVGVDSPSTADRLASRSNVTYGHNFGIQMQPTNLGLMSSTPQGSGMVGISGNHSEKKSQQQVSKAAGVESFQSQRYGMTFATLNGANTAPALNISSISQNHPMFHNIPEAARQGYHMITSQAAQQKMNYPEDGKSGSASANPTEEQRKTGTATVKPSGVNGGQSIDSSSRLHNPLQQSSTPMSQQQQQQHMQRNQSHQPYTTMYLQKQQQYATSVAASAARTKGSVASNGNGYPDHNITASPKFQNLVQSSQVQSPQWKNNLPRTTNTTKAQSPSMSSSSSLRTASHKQQTRPQQSQISFAANSKASGSQMVQGGTNGSPCTSSKNTNKAGQASSTSQPSKNLQSASVASSGSKSQHGLQQQQGQLFFSNPYMQSQHQQITISPSGGYYIQRHQQQSGSSPATCPITTASDPAKAVAATATVKGGTGKTQQHKLVPPGFPYVHAVEIKPVDQKQQAGE